MKLFLLTLLAGIIFASCYDCGPQQELTFDLSVSSYPDTIPVLKKVYSKNGVDTIDLSDKIPPYYIGTNTSLSLPLTLHENQTTYFFEFENRRDSLTVFYERKFYYDNHCGFVADVSTSKNPPRATGTFTNVRVTSKPYVGGEDANGILKSYYGGISVGVEL